MRKLTLLTSSLLSLTLSFQAMSFQSIADKNRQETVNKAKKDLTDFLGMFPFQATRTCVDMAQHKGGYFDLSGLGLMMIPGALILDTLMIPVGIIGAPVLEGKVIFQELKGRFESCGDKEKLSKELELLRGNLFTRHHQAEQLIGNRYIKSEDVLAFTLGFTVIHSLNNPDGLTLVSGQTLLEKDIEAFPLTAEQAYHSLKHAKGMIWLLPKDMQSEKGFMKALVERMTFENESDADKKSDRKFDNLDSIIHYMRDAAKNIYKTVEDLNT